MAVRDDKKRIMISLDADTLAKLDDLYKASKKDAKQRYNKSDYIANLIANDWQIKQAFR